MDVNFPLPPKISPAYITRVDMVPDLTSFNYHYTVVLEFDLDAMLLAKYSSNLFITDKPLTIYWGPRDQMVAPKKENNIRNILW